MADGALVVFWLGWWVCEVRDGRDRGRWGRVQRVWMVSIGVWGRCGDSDESFAGNGERQYWLEGEILL